MPTIVRDITISWNAVSGAVTYHVFKKKINDTPTDFIDIATVNAPTTNYTFTGLNEDERDAYQVKALLTDGITLVNNTTSIQDIYFPDKSSGIYTTDNGTPTGQPMVIPVDVSYITKDEFLLSPIARGLGISTGSPEYNDGSLALTLLQASSHVNRYCGRYFQKQTIDETFPNITIQVSNPRLTVVPLKNPPISRINTVTIQVLKWFIVFDLTYLQTFYEQHYYQIVPMLSTAGQGAPLGTGTPIPSVILEQSQLGIIWTNYTCGYDVIPEDIKYATSLIAGKMIALGKFNPQGLIGFKTQTTSYTYARSRTDNPIDDEVSKILDKYKLLTLRMV